MPTIPATFWVPLRRSRLLSATVEDGAEAVGPPPGHQGADAFGPTEFVGAHGHQIGRRGQGGDVQPRHRLHGVGVKLRRRGLPEDH